MDAIFKRRSIRKYSSDPVNDNDIEEMIRAAMAAPSAGNQQPWEFIIVKDREILNKIMGIHPYAQMLKTAYGAVIVCGDTEREVHKGYWVQDCSAAVENILIEAQDKGIGTCWLGVYPREDRVDGIRQLFEIPETVIPMAAIAFGYPAESKKQVDRFDSTRIHIDKW
jgi:nitroreductase